MLSSANIRRPDLGIAEEHQVIRVALVDDHISIIEGFQGLLDRQPDLRVVGLFTSGAEIIERFVEVQPDVILMDIQMPGINGLEATRILQSRHPETNIIILTQSNDAAAIADAFAAGARGYLIKNTRVAQIISAIRRVVAGESVIDPTMQTAVVQEFQRLRDPDARTRPKVATESFTPREITLLDGLGRGWSNKEIADHLGLAEQTVNNQLSALYRKIGVTDRIQAALFAVQYQADTNKNDQI